MKRRAPREVPPEPMVEKNLAPGLDLNSQANNYLNWITDLCRPHIRGRILEIGAGRGDFTGAFATLGHVTATELSEETLSTLKSRFHGNSNVEVRSFDLFADHSEKFDTVILINVLEHIRDDQSALASIYGLLNPGGRVVLYVPAFWLLYSRFDNSIGHYRRYRLRELRWLAEQEGLRTVEGKYVNALGALGWLVICRVLGRDASEGASVGLMNKVVVPVMRKFERLIRTPFGISILYIGERNP